jgi:hypothetical protein
MALINIVRKCMAIMILAGILGTSCAPDADIRTLTPEPTKMPQVTHIPAEILTIEPLPDYLAEYQKSCNTPEECGQKLIDMGWTYVRDGDVASPLSFLKSRKGDCGDLVTTLAFGVEDNGFASYLLVLISKDSNNIHDIYPFKSPGGLWGYVSLTNNLMEYKIPQYQSMDELFTGYKKSHPKLNYYEYFLYDLNKPEMTNGLKDGYGIADWRTTDRYIPLISQGLIGLGITIAPTLE